MAKNSTRKKALKEFHKHLKIQRTDESNKALRVQSTILKKKMKEAKQKALRKQAEAAKPEIITAPDASVEQRFLETKITEDSGSLIVVTEKLPPKEDFQTLQDSYDPPADKITTTRHLTFKDIIKHGL